MGSEDEDGYPAEPLAVPCDPAERHLTVVCLQREEIADHEIGARSRRDIVEVRGADGRVPRVFEHRAYELEYGGVVIEGENASHHAFIGYEVTEPQLSRRLKWEQAGTASACKTSEEQHARLRSCLGTNQHSSTNRSRRGGDSRTHQALSALGAAHAPHPRRALRPDPAQDRPRASGQSARGE